ncbi:DUF3592 domain-containing protein [Cytophaga sp. FL35]|uniref:DUF3592 domain-containing protein n=1 Tax=Cytophaga sp. FL35 TaxID=1904456 RepID=UPI001653B9FB|nr:DUF3592 domain-containing protein [Cytophaga sp. FL35]MBC6999672.1 hypothetical protein [Cytophaga sp. FL35]
MKKDSQNTREGVWSHIIIGILILAVLVYHYNKDSSVAKYRTETIGVIIKFKHRNKASYSLKYEYYVDGIRYEGSVGTSYFKCPDGREGCVGKEVTVYYSSNEPKYSQVNLKEYDEYRRTVYLNE